MNKKHKAFTFAELMVMMSVLTIVLAALSPVFTAKYINASSDIVWHYVALDNNKNAYSNEKNSFALAESFIGITPTAKQIEDPNLIQRAKVVIRPTDALSTIQPQIDLRFQTTKNNSGAGTYAGSIVADNVGNFLFGGPYDYKRGDNYPKRNTSFGKNAFGSLTFHSIMEDNTAIGFNALRLAGNKSHGNTVIGFNDIGTNHANTTVEGNTLIGYRTTTNYSNQNVANYNTAIGDYALNNMLGGYNTVVGTNVAIRLNSSSVGNVAIGYNSLATNEEGEKLLTSSYSTAIGAYSGYLDEKESDIKGDYNTFVGYNSGAAIGKKASNKTCIGAYSCNTDMDPETKMFTDDEERVFIGRAPWHTNEINSGNLKYGNGGFAVLEVHNVNSRSLKDNNFRGKWKEGSSYPNRKLGDASVIINGNLVVRGQTYITSPTPVDGFYKWHYYNGMDKNYKGQDVNEDGKEMRIDVSKDALSYQKDPYYYYMGLHGFTYGRVDSKTTIQGFYASNGSDRDRGSGMGAYGELSGKHYREHRKDISRVYCLCAPGVYSYDWTTRVAPAAQGSSGNTDHYGMDRELFKGRGKNEQGPNSGGYCDLSLNEKNGNADRCDSMVYVGTGEHGPQYASFSEAHNRYNDESTFKNADEDTIKDVVFYNFNLGSAKNYTENAIRKNQSVRDMLIDKGDASWVLNPSAMSLVNKYGKATPQTCGCCPNLLSDSRLKDVGEAYTSGLSELKKLKIYNYVFKNDSLRVAHVGVIAQDLKRIFPNAVYKDENGYYKIRWDEMFYAAINAVKELNTRIDSLALRVHNDIERVETLKRDNAELAKKLDKLSAELAALEKVKK